MVDPATLALSLGLGAAGAFASSLMGQPSPPKAPDQLTPVQQPVGKKPQPTGGMPTGFLAGAKAAGSAPGTGQSGMGKSLLGA